MRQRSGPAPHTDGPLPGTGLRWRARLHRSWAACCAMQHRLHQMGHSLRVRLLVVFLLLALALGVTFMIGTQRALSMGWRDLARPLVTDYVDRLVADLGTPPEVARAQALVQRLPLSVLIRGPEVNWASHPAHVAELRRHDEWRDQWLTRDLADGHRVTLGLGDMPWRKGPRGMVWLTLGVLLAFTLAAWMYLRRLFLPLAEIGAGAQRMGAGDFSQPIPQRRDDELGTLAGQINRMGHDLQHMLESQRALLLAISHELRSPLTRARLHTELLPDDGPDAATRSALLRDLTEMRDLIQDLLESERLSGRHAALQREAVDLPALVRQVVADHETTHPGQAPVVLHLSEAPANPVAVDPTRLRLLLRNLLDNARRYGPKDGPPPEVSLRVDQGQLQLSVRDHGPGVPDEHLAHLGQPFYRADPARQRTTGGVGLGLYLCRLVAQAHGGHLQLSRADPGLRVQAQWPL